MPKIPGRVHASQRSARPVADTTEGCFDSELMQRPDWFRVRRLLRWLYLNIQLFPQIIFEEFRNAYSMARVGITQRCQL